MRIFKESDEGKEEEEIRLRKKQLSRIRWVFCCAAIHDMVSQKKREWTWSHMKAFRQSSRRYVDLYIKTKKNASSDEEREELRALEERMEFETQMHYRKIGLSFLRRDRLYQEEMRRWACSFADLFIPSFSITFDTHYF